MPFSFKPYFKHWFLTLLKYTESQSQIVGAFPRNERSDCPVVLVEKNCWDLIKQFLFVQNQLHISYIQRFFLGLPDTDYFIQSWLLSTRPGKKQQHSAVMAASQVLTCQIVTTSRLDKHLPDWTSCKDGIISSLEVDCKNQFKYRQNMSHWSFCEDLKSIFWLCHG